MRIIADNEAGQLRLTHDKFDTELVMDYEQQLDRYELGIREGGEITLVDPVARLEGEHDEVFFDRAAIKAYSEFLGVINDRVKEQSRHEQMHYLLGKITETLDHMGLIIAHWDNDKPTEAHLENLRDRLEALRYNDTELGELS